MPIQVTLTEFMNFVLKSGSAKHTIVKQAKKRHEDVNSPYTPGSDYWYYLRRQISEYHKKGKEKEFLENVLSSIPSDRRDNYKKMIDGYKKFLGKKKKFDYIAPTKQTWSVGDIRVVLNPELTLEYNGRVCVIKLFLSADNVIDRKHADLILTLMEAEMRSKVGGEEPIFAVLDVKRGKLFTQNNKGLDLMVLLEGEARSFETQWKKL